ncbi:MAG: proprotein convertase P-domain-containing protein [Planctomycetes bacterium]|nr:proprotein convertase P-domain-containing protein [Planctomycetota bacterium]
MGLLNLAPRALAGTFSNATPITIPASGTGDTTGAPASPYPSIISVAGIPGNEVIRSLTVTLLDFSHAFPDDVDILLIGPNGTRVLLMSDAGASTGVAGIDLTFRDVAGPLPDATAVTAGTYRPTNYGTPDAFPAPVPAAPHGSMLAAFVDSRPNGDWSLYVVDDAEFDTGTIAGGWVLSLTTVATQCGNEIIETGENCDDGNLQAGDGCGPTCLFEVCGNGFVDPGEGCDDGNVTSGDGCTSTCVVEYCGDGITQAGIGETCDDGNTLAGDGCGPTCLIEGCGNGFVDPGEDCDDGNTVACDGCDACVRVGSPFCNPTPIIIPAPPSTGDGAGAPADPYPSVITVAGFPAGYVVSGLTVTLAGLSHTNPDDVDVLLIGPDGTNAFLMSDAGGDANVVAINLTFADGAAQVPDNTVIASGTYAPTNHGTPDFFPAPAPAPPYGSTLTAFIGSNPNGTWSLYIVDDSGNFETGTVGGGWTLDIMAEFAQCGNGNVEPGEECDDGNLVAGDGCGPLCNLEVCGNGTVDPGETCDDANTVACDGCHNCAIETAAVCGNGVTECGEDCDDANTNQTDGCLADCTQGAAVPAPPAGCQLLFYAFDATDTPITINAAGTPTITSTINVTGVRNNLSSVWDVNVVTKLKHTASGDLDITLTSPAGTSVTLTTDNGGANDDVFDGTVWDDQADTRFSAPHVPGSSKLVTDAFYSNRVRKTFLAPEEPLAAFNDEDPNGVWTLTASDDTDGNGGDLESWTLSVSTLTESANTNLYPAEVRGPILPIPSGPAVVKDSMTLAGYLGSIRKVTVATDITHPQNADLDITLTSPAGTTVTLTTDNGGPNDNAFAGTVWDDDADPGNPAPYNFPNLSSNLVTDTAYTNLVAKPTLVPEEPLAAFNGEDPNGTWTLTIGDDASPNSGTLNSWSIEVTTHSCEPQLCELPLGNDNPDDPCYLRRSLDCAGEGSDLCRPSAVTVQLLADKVEVVMCDCYYPKGTDCDNGVAISPTAIHCSFGACGTGECSILEDGISLNTFDLPIASMIPGAEYSCGCGEPPAVPGDSDGDGDVDMGDLSTFFPCFGQSPLPPGCNASDIDGDGDVDRDDFAVLLANFNGPQP